MLLPSLEMTVTLNFRLNFILFYNNTLGCIPYINVPIAQRRIWKYTVLYCASHISMSTSLTAAYESTLYYIVHPIYQCPHRSQPHMEVHCIMLCIPYINVPIAHSRIWKYTVLYCVSYIYVQIPYRRYVDHFKLHVNKLISDIYCEKNIHFEIIRSNTKIQQVSYNI